MGTFAGGAMLGGAAMFMQPGTVMMGVTAGASAGAAVGSGIISAGIAASDTARWAGKKARFIREVERSGIGTDINFVDAYAQTPVYSGAAQTMGQPAVENTPKQGAVSPVSVKKSKEFTRRGHHNCAEASSDLARNGCGKCTTDRKYSSKNTGRN